MASWQDWLQAAGAPPAPAYQAPQWKPPASAQELRQRFLNPSATKYGYFPYYLKDLKGLNYEQIYNQAQKGIFNYGTKYGDNPSARGDVVGYMAGKNRPITFNPAQLQQSQEGDLHRQILQGYGFREQEAMGMLEGMGSQARRDIEQRWAAAYSRGLQEMYSRGMASPYLLPSMGMGYQRQMGGELGGLEDQLRQMRLGTYTGLSGQTLGYLSSYEAEKLAVEEKKRQEKIDRWKFEKGMQAQAAAANASRWETSWQAAPILSGYPG